MSSTFVHSACGRNEFVPSGGMSLHRRMCLAAMGMLVAAVFPHAASAADHPLAAPGVTSLTDPDVKFTVPDAHHAVLKRGSVTAVIVDNAAEDLPLLPGHKAGYNGVASLSHVLQPRNLFVPAYAGLNFEHIHDGTAAISREKFEPRKAPMQLRVIDEHTVELYQPPTHNWKLESCGRYQILADGTLEYTFECIPRANDYRDRMIGLFWASYIHQPEDKSIHFKGRPADREQKSDWIRGVTPQHGVDATHPPAGARFRPKIDTDFPLTLVNHPSKYVATEPWYFGVSGKMAFVQMFRDRDQIWIAQSPSGGGSGNPAWDFQWFIPKVEVGQAYGFVMRAALIPFESREQVKNATETHRRELNPRQ